MNSILLSRIVSETIQQVYLHPVRFELIWEEFPEFEDGIQEEIEEDMKELKLSEEEKVRWRMEMNGLTWDTVVLPYTKVTFMSENNGNSDTRGGGCGELDIPVEEFVWKCKNRKGITLKQLTEGVYRMKGSKYDWWYELFEGIEIIPKGGKGEKKAIIKTSFGYGS